MALLSVQFPKALARVLDVVPLSGACHGLMVVSRGVGLRVQEMEKKMELLCTILMVVV